MSKQVDKFLTDLLPLGLILLFGQTQICKTSNHIIKNPLMSRNSPLHTRNPSNHSYKNSSMVKTSSNQQEKMCYHKPQNLPMGVYSIKIHWGFLTTTAKKHTMGRNIRKCKISPSPKAREIKNCQNCSNKQLFVVDSCLCRVHITWCYPNPYLQCTAVLQVPQLKGVMLRFKLSSKLKVYVDASN